MIETKKLPAIVAPLKKRIAAFDVYDASPTAEDALSKEFREILDRTYGKFYDLPYARLSPSQRLDLYLPNRRTESRCPVIVYFHGNAFSECGKRDEAALPVLRGLERGYAVVCAEFRKSSEAKYPAIVHDAKAVIRWVRANAEKYGLDRQRIAAWGMSAGGWLASFLSVTNCSRKYEAPELGNAEYSSQVQACVDWCGPCADFSDLDDMLLFCGADVPDPTRPDAPESRLPGQAAEISAFVRETSPITHIRPDAVPFLLIHGGADRVVPVEQSVRFAGELNRLGGEGTAKLYVAPDMSHQKLSRCREQRLSDVSLDFLDSVFKSSKRRTQGK